ncbi:MAG: AMP-binding protein [Acidobacteriia bacterium]|nr:AMP-binding protein [Terriglobia bacterium]
MTFLQQIFARLEQAAGAPVLREIRDGRIVSVTGGELLALIQQARQFLAARGMKKGDRCALLAPNGIRWAALDLAAMAEGLIVVPLYARQAFAELAGMVKDATPALLCASDDALAAEIRARCPAATEIALFDTIFSGAPPSPAPCHGHADHDAVTIIYTSGTSGEPKGVVLNAGNITHMVSCTNARLDQLMGTRQQPDRAFHYLPFCFAGSWILLLTALSRNSVLTLSTDLAKLADELKLAGPDYFLNVPTLLERVRAKIEESVRQRGGWTAAVFARAQRQYLRRRTGEGRFFDSLALWLAGGVMFPAIRKTIGPNLKALICGSAPLSLETQLFFMMLGIPVLQVYGLTETTAICTMDDPRHYEPGRVGPAIPGVEMTLSDAGEILVRGPNIFPGYWQRPAETAKALEGGWFHTGDQGEADAQGNWRITGRLKNLIILNSGHNIAPEPIEEALAARLPEAQQVMLLGNQRSFLAALLATQGANALAPGRVQSAVDAFNTGLPHYKQIHAFHVVSEPFSIENGLLTANGKLKRDAIAARFAREIEQMFEKKPA